MGLEPITSFDQLNAYLATEYMVTGNAFCTTRLGLVRRADRSDLTGFELGERVAIEMEGCSDAPQWIMVREGRGIPERTITNPQWRPPRPRDPD